MFAFFQCVAEAIVEKGVSGLASMVPGGPFAVEVGRAVWSKYRQRRRDDEIRADLQALAQSGFAQAREAAAEAARAATGGQAPPIELELYVSQIPAAVKQSLKRPEDPTGTTVPAAFALTSADDVLKLLPPRPPRFRDGDPLPGKPGWVLEKPLGVGGFGEVWLARHPQMTSLHGAVKFCHGEHARQLQHEGGLIDRVMQHGQHPNIVRLLDASLDGETPWLMFEYVPGGDLADWARGLRRLPPEQRNSQVVLALRQLAGAVGHFHRLTPPVVHRDLKPSNILTEKATRRLRITDFGIGAIAAKSSLGAEAAGTTTEGGRTLSFLRGSHTPLYAPTQQRLGFPPDPRDDVHALGVIGYQLVTGHLDQGTGPDFADDLRENGAPEALIALLGRCVAQKPDRRPRDGTELADALGQIGTGATPSTTPAEAQPTPNPSPPCGLPRISPTPADQHPLPAPASATAGKSAAGAVPASQSSATRPVVAESAVKTTRKEPRGAHEGSDRRTGKAAPLVEEPEEDAPIPDGEAGGHQVDLPGTWWARPVGDPEAVWRRVCKIPGRVPVVPGKENGVRLAQSITDAELSGLASLNGLTSLRFIEFPARKKITDTGLEHLPTLTGLTGLRLARTRIGDGTLARLSGFAGLTGLDLAETAITDAGLAHLSRLTQLEELTIGTPGITDTGLAALAGLTRLRLLDVMGTEVTDAGLVHLAGMADLAVLFLDFTRVTDAGFDVIGRLTELRRLCASDCEGISGAGLRHLTRLNKLDSLFLMRTGVTDEMLGHLVSLGSLEALRLDETAVTDGGLVHLTRLPRLEELHLAGCAGITDAGVGSLIRMTSLKALEVRQTGITQDGVSRLIAAFGPRCRVEWV